MRRNRPWLLYVYAFLVYAFLFAPVVVVVVNSVNDNASRTDWRGFTTRWYKEAWSSDQAVEAAKNSLLIAALVAVASAVLGTAGALALARSRRFTRGFLNGTTYARIVIPELVLALVEDAGVLHVVQAVHLGLHGEEVAGVADVGP